MTKSSSRNSPFPTGTAIKSVLYTPVPNMPSNLNLTGDETINEPLITILDPEENSIVASLNFPSPTVTVFPAAICNVEPSAITREPNVGETVST